MRKFIFLILFLQFLTGVSLAAPTEASRINKAKRKIQRADRYLTSVQKRMRTEKQPVPTIVAGWKNKVEKANEFLSQSEEILNSVGSASEERALLEATQAKLEKVRSAVAHSADSSDKATALAQSAGGQQAVDDYKQLAATFLSVTQWIRDNDDNPKMMDAYQNALTAKSALDQKYASVLGMRTQETFPITSAANQAKMTQQGVLNDIAYAKSMFPQVIGQLLKQAKDGSQVLVKNKAFGGWETTVQSPLDLAKLKAQKLNSVAPSDPVALAASREVEAVAVELNGKKMALKSAFISSNKMPEDAYRGSDAGALKAAIKRAWAQRFPKDRVLQISIADSQWSDFAGTEWVNSSRSWQRYDFDRMKGYVLVAGPTQYNYKFLALVVRQNLEGGRIEILPTRPSDPEQHISTLVSK